MNLIEQKANIKKLKWSAKHIKLIILRDRKKVSISILFQKFCLRWKLSPIINRRGGRLDSECPGWKKIEKLISGVGGEGDGGGESIRHSRVWTA